MAISNISKWSVPTNEWTTAQECDPEGEYLNTTCDYPLGKRDEEGAISVDCQEWGCKVCPDGASCSGLRSWNDVKAKFGYWRHNADLSQPSNFTKCLFAPACNGDKNEMFKNLFVNKSGYDPAMTDQPEGCSMDIGYSSKCLGNGAPRCRLCATCKL